MRSFPAAQTSLNYDPIWKIELTSGTASYEYDRTRVIDIVHTETPDSGMANVILNNSDNALTGIDFENYRMDISYGINSTYSTCAPLKVRSQEFHSGMGLLTCNLKAIGIPDQFDEEAASSEYKGQAADTITAKGLINAIAAATLSPYTGYVAATITWDTASSLPDVNVPADSFNVGLNESRWDKIKELIGNTDTKIRAEANNRLHVIDPVLSGTAYAYEYKFNVADSHWFFDKTSRYRFVTPNKEVVSSNPDHTPQYSANATSTTSYNLSPRIHTTYMRLASTAQASSIAVAKITSNELDAEIGFATVPMNVAQEVWDYVKITDSRQGDTRTGNIQYIQRNVHVPRGKGKLVYNMVFSFGKVAKNTVLSNVLTFDTAQLSQEKILELFNIISLTLEELADRDNKVINFVNSKFELLDTIPRLHVTEQLIIPVE